MRTCGHSDTSLLASGGPITKSICRNVSESYASGVPGDKLCWVGRGGGLGSKRLKGMDGQS
eukprot:14797851-Alexandrium_andersonii.AAC.1